MMPLPSDPTRWPDVKRLFDAALDLAPADREAFLNRECRTSGGEPDLDLRQYVQTLLDADAEAGTSDTDTNAPEARHGSASGGFLATSPFSLSGLLDGLGVELVTGTISRRLRRPPPEVSPETHIGPYKVLRLLGRGGMGEVYLAARADGLFERLVALKRVRADLAPAVAERFTTERQILAGLVHPGIARLYAAGTDDDGRPWLAMEPVDGEPMPDYARGHALTERERIGLIQQVCAAVQHAHQQRVIHRDIKPSNVLVVDTEEGPRAQLLDFGIATILGRDASTRRFLTRAYAAPEQLQGDPATAASDVYALGALLVETLTGERPSEPGTAPGLSGDLAAIARRALAPASGDRYPSPEALAGDLRRYLDGQPVTALPPTLAYRARRFAGRHRRPLAAGTAALAVVLVGLSISAHNVVRERRLAAQAVADADAVLETQGTLLRVLEPTYRATLDSVSAAHEVPLAEAVDASIATVEEAYAENPAALAGTLLALGTTLYQRGQMNRADSLFARSLALRRPLARKGDGVVRNALLGRGHVAKDRGDREAARRYYREAIAIEREYPEVLEDGGVGAAQIFLAAVLEDADARERSLLRTLTERRRAFGDTSRWTAQAHNALGVHYANQGEFPAAYAELVAAQRIVARLMPESDPSRNTLTQNLAVVAVGLGRLDDAQRHARAGMEAAQRAGLGPLTESHFRLVLGHAYFHQDRLVEAEQEIREAHRLEEREQGPSAPGSLRMLTGLAVVLAEQGRTDEARTILRRVVTGHRAAGTLDEMEGLVAVSTADALAFASGDRAAAARLARLARGLPVDASPITRRVVLGLAGDALRESGDAAAAEGLLRDALAAALESSPEGQFNVVRAHLAYGRALAALGRTAEARPHLEAARGRIPRVRLPSLLSDVDAEIDRLLAAE